MENTTISPPAVIHKPRRSMAWIGQGFLLILAVLVVVKLGSGLLANPTLFLTWTAILSFLSAHGLLSDYFWDKILFSFATGLGSALWFLGLLLFVHSNRHTISPKFLRRIGVATAIVIIGFGVYFSVTIFQQMSGTA